MGLFRLGTFGAVALASSFSVQVHWWQCACIILAGKRKNGKSAAVLDSALHSLFRYVKSRSLFSLARVRALCFVCSLFEIETSTCLSLLCDRRWKKFSSSLVSAKFFRFVCLSLNLFRKILVRFSGLDYVSENLV